MFYDDGMPQIEPRAGEAELPASAPIPPLETVDVAPRDPAGFAEWLGEEGVAELRETASRIRERLGRRVIWNVNTTAAGGGVAEMLHTLLAYVRGLGVETRWALLRGEEAFFTLTKRLHHSLHGESGDGTGLGRRQRAIYERVMRDNVEAFAPMVRRGDIVILHDPQTAGLAGALARRGAVVVWRCHIGADAPTPESERGWAFLAPYLADARAYVFSRYLYAPRTCDPSRTVVIAPSIDPFSPKNQHLDDTAVAAILQRAGLVDTGVEAAAGFVRDDGTPGTVRRRARVLRGGAAPPADAPLVVQVSRWDPLKDPVGVMQGFRRMLDSDTTSAAHLMLVGPDASAVTDDPEGARVHGEVVAAWRAMPSAVRERIHLVDLPMDDLQENAAMVNAIQRHATVVVQKSLREGFGLTVTEAMWKGRAVVASAVGGIQDQIDHGASGLLLRDPGDLEAFAATLREPIRRPGLAARLGRNARRRVGREFLGVRSLLRFADLLEGLWEVEG